jgi:hypothetical protein
MLLPRVPEIFDLIQRSLSDEERTDAVVKSSFGLIGDLAETFPNGQLKNLLLAEWIHQELRSKSRMSSETKRTARWAREVSDLYLTSVRDYVLIVLFAVGQAGDRINSSILCFQGFIAFFHTSYLSLSPSNPSCTYCPTTTSTLPIPHIHHFNVV